MEQGELVLVVKQTPEASRLRPGESFKLRGEGLAGRSPEVDVHLEDRTVSRQHARFFEDEGGWWVENVTRHNGVFIDAAAVLPGERAPLPETVAQIQLGGVLLRVHVMLGTVPVTEALQTPQEPFLRTVRDGDRCSVFCKGRFVPMKPTSALALHALLSAPGDVVHAWDLHESMGQTCNLPQALSGVRRALRALLGEGWITASELRALIRGASSGEHLQDLDALDAAALIRRFVMARRGHGYIVMAPPGAVTTETAG